MERRLLLVFALTFLVIVLFQPILKRYLPQPPTPAAQNQPQPAPANNPPAAAQSQVPAEVAKPTNATKQASAESVLLVENEFYKITLTNRGAQVKSWILKKYDDDNGHPLDLVNAAAAATYGFPLLLWTYDESLRNKLNSVLYVAAPDREPKSDALSKSFDAPTKIRFEYADQDLKARKVIRFEHGYVIHIEASVLLKGNPVAAFPAWPAGFGDQTTLAAYHSGQVEYQYNNTTEHLDLKKVSGGGTQRGPFNWAGVSDSYFTATLIPDSVEGASLVTLRNPLDVPKDPRKPEETQQVDVLGVAVGSSSGPTSERMYVGPKSLDVLESIPVPTINGADKDLRAVVNFGFWGAIARPLFAWRFIGLRWWFGYVHNWGWAIVIQTAIITLALLPLRISQMKSALKMQKAAPQIKAIQEKYKKYSMRDPRKQEMNKEITDLYKREGVNPIGGCLPLVIQLPFIFAYYKMLQAAIELRHAHWLWIHDLSSRDPYFILPILLVVSMIATQRMTPQAGMDPAQQKMMNVMMPLMMGFIFFNLASGLNLYYALSNLISIAQQVIMNRTKLGQEMREMAAKRARKKDK
jgi:YidC/Oxa1 family membrane protein insertase